MSIMDTVGQPAMDAIQKSTIGSLGVTYTFMGMPFADLAALLTAVYMGAQLIYFLFKVYKEWKSKRKVKESGCNPDSKESN